MQLPKLKNSVEARTAVLQVLCLIDPSRSAKENLKSIISECIFLVFHAISLFSVQKRYFWL